MLEQIDYLLAEDEYKYMGSNLKEAYVEGLVRNGKSVEEINRIVSEIFDEEEAVDDDEDIDAEEFKN